MRGRYRFNETPEARRDRLVAEFQREKAALERVFWIGIVVLVLSCSLVGFMVVHFIAKWW